MALPLLIPWNVVGTIWQIFGRADIGLLGHTLDQMGFEYNYASNVFDAWVTIILMDVWHWTSLVVLLCYAGLVSIPEAYYQAAKIDGASKWSVFRYIQLPKIRGVLIIAFLLRFMDSFMIYTEPFVLDRWRAGQLDHIHVDRPCEAGHRPVRSGPGGRNVACLSADRSDHLLRLLHGDEQCRRR
jgi:ABC-type sugar transport system permease subunit